jgi:cysteinyl-tRNA synthetase
MPAAPNRPITWYMCGPTVYDFAHLGRTCFFGSLCNSFFYGSSRFIPDVTFVFVCIAWLVLVATGM